ncbi:MAG: kynureninase [Planctomycetota bacterium]
MSALKFRSDEAYARDLDARDPLAGFRDRFHIPLGQDGKPLHYFCGNSLGLQPKEARSFLERELEDWRDLAVHGHFRARTPWYSYHEVFRESGALLVGAQPGEVVMMNALTVNLHLMMVSFYRPTPERYKILIEENTFPSDVFAVQSQLRYHGFDPAEGLMVLKAKDTQEIEEFLEQHGSEIALVMLGGVNYFTGQLFNMACITAAAHRQGCVVGFDLAHAAGNVPLSLHDWNVDFAVWCNYKYVNAGPGAVAGCFVHERHAQQDELPRFAGWWGNDPEQRFVMLSQFEPRHGADGWQISNPPIFSMAPLRASLAIFEEAGLTELRKKSELLTGYLEFLIDEITGEPLAILTPRQPEARGCQLSIRVHRKPRELLGTLEAHGMVCDFREPDVIRVAPVPLYNTFHEVWDLAQLLREQCGGQENRGR